MKEIRVLFVPFISENPSGSWFLLYLNIVDTSQLSASINDEFCYGSKFIFSYDEKFEPISMHFQRFPMYLNDGTSLKSRWELLPILFQPWVTFTAPEQNEPFVDIDVKLIHYIRSKMKNVLHLWNRARYDSCHNRSFSLRYRRSASTGEWCADEVRFHSFEPESSYSSFTSRHLATQKDFEYTTLIIPMSLTPKETVFVAYERYPSKEQNDCPSQLPKFKEFEMKQDCESNDSILLRKMPKKIKRYDCYWTIADVSRQPSPLNGSFSSNLLQNNRLFSFVFRSWNYASCNMGEDREMVLHFTHKNEDLNYAVYDQDTFEEAEFQLLIEKWMDEDEAIKKTSTSSKESSKRRMNRKSSKALEDFFLECQKPSVEKMKDICSILQATDEFVTLQRVRKWFRQKRYDRKS